MGKRKRVGIMMPAADGTAEPDFQMVLGARDIVVHGHRLRQGTDDISPAENFERMNAEIEPAARYLSQVKLDAIAYCCTTGSFFKGPGWDKEMLQLITKASGVPAFATTPSVVEALHHYGAKKLSVITPYPEWNNLRLKEFMEAKGFEVLNVDPHPKPSSGAILAYEQDPDEILEFGIEKCDPGNPGGRAYTDFGYVAFTPAFHSSSYKGRYMGQPCGLVINIAGIKIYHAGDTDLIPEVSSVRCDIALLPVSGSYCMHAEEAAQAAVIIKPRIAIPMHYGQTAGS
ncbi:MAG: MBL fold metallo-hydrolase, partial [Chloroflexi bacterium]|nr:MBL fold metallo-hydrolase [Chloroflexota bacterium]